MLTHLSLFSGIGGLDIVAEMAGFVTVGQVEFADFQTKVLERHWPDVPRWRDIRTLTGDSFHEKTGLRTVDVISGGFPCQPFSVAGKHRGEEDDRYLWPEMLRVIRELRPAWVIGENVPGIINLALDTVLSDLENEGYTVQPLIIPACGVDAPHKRERVVILAYTNGKQLGRVGTQENAETDAGEGSDHGRGIQKSITWERRKDESSAAGMDDGIYNCIHTTDPNTNCIDVQGRMSETACWGGNYDSNLQNLLESTPRGTIGRMNPNWIEWLMGYPIGWTDLGH